MGLSIRAYAQSRAARGLPGGSHTAVRKAIAAGRVTPEADGTIDPERADAQWSGQTDPAKQRGAGSADARNTADGADNATPAERPVPQAAIDAVQDTLGETGEAPAPGGQVTFMRARLATEVLKAQLQKEQLKRVRGEVVDRNKAVAMVFDLARKERDAWTGWPARVAANMAAELGVEAHELEQVLDHYLREHLGELAEVRIDFR
ncbi:elements of external origin [Roseinatronobacter sp.]